MTEIQMLSEIAVKVGKLEALQEANARAIGDMANAVNRLVEKLDQSDDIARDADSRAKSAHHRLNRIDKIIFWAGTTMIGSFLALIITAVSIVIKTKGAG